MADLGHLQPRIEKPEGPRASSETAASAQSWVDPDYEFCETCAHTRDEHDFDGRRGHHVFKGTGRFDR